MTVSDVQNSSSFVPKSAEITAKERFSYTKNAWMLTKSGPTVGTPKKIPKNNYNNWTSK